MQGFWNGFEKRAATVSGGDNGLVTQYIHKFPLRNEEEKSKYRRASAAAGGLILGIPGALIGGHLASMSHLLKNKTVKKGIKGSAGAGAVLGSLIGGGIGAGITGYQAMRESNKGFGTTHSTHSPEDAKLKAEKYHKPFFKTIMGMGD